MKVTYQRAYSIGPFLQEKIGFDDEAPDGIDPLQVILQLKSLCDEAHQKLNPGSMYDGPPLPDTMYDRPIKDVWGVSHTIPIQSSTVTHPTNTIDWFIHEIENCTAIDQKNAIGVQVGLLAYEHLTATPKIKEAYDKKQKELS